MKIVGRYLQHVFEYSLIISSVDSDREILLFLVFLRVQFDQIDEYNSPNPKEKISFHSKDNQNSPQVEM